MADLTKYKAYNDAMQLSNAVIKTYRHFPNDLRHTIGKSLVFISLDLIDCVAEGLDGYDKERKQRNILEAIKLTRKIESRMLLAADNQCLDNEHAGWYIEHIPNLRRQLEGFSNSLARQRDTDTSVSENL